MTGPEIVWLSIGFVIGAFITERVFYITDHPRTIARRKRRSN